VVSVPKRSLSDYLGNRFVLRLAINPLLLGRQPCRDTAICARPMVA
jgi:hypothetical protein